MMWCTGSSSTAVTPSDVRYAIASGAREAAVRAAQILAHAVAELREPLDVQLVDHASRSTACAAGRSSSSSQSNDGSMTTHFGIAGAESDSSIVRSASSAPAPGTYGSVFAASPVDRAVDRLRVRVDQQLRRVEAAARRRARTARARGSRSAGRADAGQVAVPVERGALAQLDALLVAVLVEEAELDPLRVLGEEREVRAVAVPLRAERERRARSRPDASTSRGTVPVAADAVRGAATIRSDPRRAQAADQLERAPPTPRRQARARARR